MARRIPAVLAAWLLPAAALGHGMPHSPPEPGVSYAATPCLAPKGLGAELHCGHLTVPEDYDNPDGLRLRLPVLRIGPVDPDHTAVALGGGGPGASAARHDPYNVLDWDDVRRHVLDGRGLIVMDQRGVGEDYPLRCPGGARLAEWEYSRDPTPAELEDAVHGWARECRRRLAGMGIDLGNYTTRESARDYENLRRALGIRRLDLIGISYGARIAFAMIDAHPESVRVAVLDSPLIPEAEPLPPLVRTDRLFDRLADECLADAHCAGDYGDMRANMRAALRRLEAAPMSRHYPYWDTLGENARFLLTRDRLSELVRHAFYREDLIALLPPLLRSLARDGKSALVPRFVTSMLESRKDEDFAEGLFDSISCRERAPYFQDVEPTRSGIEWFRPPSDEPGEDYCFDVWYAGPPIPPRPPGGFDHPVLLLTGTLDPITPAGPAEALAARVPSVRHVTIAGTHGLINTECGLEVAREFMRNPRAPVEAPDRCEWEPWWLR